MIVDLKVIIMMIFLIESISNKRESYPDGTVSTISAIKGGSEGWVEREDRKRDVVDEV